MSTTSPELVDGIDVRPLRRLVRQRMHAPTRYRVRYCGRDGCSRWHRVYRGAGADPRTLFIYDGSDRLVLDPLTEFALEST